MLNTQIVKRPLQIQVDNISLSGLYVAPAEQMPRALLVALHGGGLSAGMFDVSVAGEATFLETAAGLGYAVIALDRPGYRASAEIAPDQSTFPNQVDLLVPALQQAWEQYGGASAGIHLVGHSIGGMIALCLAARKNRFPLIGVSTHSAGLVWLTRHSRGAPLVDNGCPSRYLPS